MRWVMWIVAVIGIAALAVVIVGAMLPKEHSVSRTVRVRMSADALYSLLADVDRFPGWRSDVKSLERRPDVDGRPAWIEEAGGMKIPLRFERMERPSLLVSRIGEGLPFGGTWTYRIAPVSAHESELTITEDGEVYNVFFRFMSKFVFGHYATMDTFLRHLQSRAAR